MLNINKRNDSCRKGHLTFLFDHNTTLHRYDVNMTLPSMSEHSLSIEGCIHINVDEPWLANIVKELQTYAESNYNVEQISLNYTGWQYTVIVLLRELSEQGLSDAYYNFWEICQKYEDPRPLVTVLGPQQKDSFILLPPSSYIVYSNAGRSHTPITSALE
jgi:hypothetical protein